MDKYEYARREKNGITHFCKIHLLLNTSLRFCLHIKSIFVHLMWMFQRHWRRQPIFNLNPCHEVCALMRTEAKSPHAARWNINHLPDVVTVLFYHFCLFACLGLPNVCVCVCDIRIFACASTANGSIGNFSYGCSRCFVNRMKRNKPMRAYWHVWMACAMCYV